MNVIVCWLRLVSMTEFRSSGEDRWISLKGKARAGVEGLIGEL